MREEYFEGASQQGPRVQKDGFKVELNQPVKGWHDVPMTAANATLQETEHPG